MKALPVPTTEVPLQDIVAFADKRRDQRWALMAAVDEVYQSVLASPDRPLAEHHAIEKVTLAAKEQLEAIHDSRLPFRLFDLLGDFNLAAGAAAALGSVALGQAWPMVVGNSLLAGASASLSKVLGVLNPKKAATPYRYVATYHDEVFRPE